MHSIKIGTLGSAKGLVGQDPERKKMRRHRRSMWMILWGWAQHVWVSLFMPMLVSTHHRGGPEQPGDSMTALISAIAGLA